MGKEATYKKIRAADFMKQIMTSYFYELDEAARDPGKRVAWCTSVGPAEILRALGFYVHFPENHGAMLGATRLAADFIPVANALGYSPDICSYLTSDIGSYMKKLTPLSRAYPGIDSVPGPDVLVYNTNQCRDVQDWFQWYGREFGVPVLGIETHRGVGEVLDPHVNSVSRQMENLIDPLAEISGIPFDHDRLVHVLSLSRRTSDLWKDVLDTALHRPAPLTFFDGTIHMGPAVVLRGDERAVSYYEVLLEELKERVAAGVAAVEGERYRIYWDGMPVWGRLRDHSGLFMDLRTCVVASTYCNSWIFQAFDPGDPFRSMAQAYTELFIVRSEPYKQKYIEDMVDRFAVDGVLFHDAKTCPNNSNNRYGLPERLTEKKGIPCLTINGDLNDLRCYSEEQAVTNIEAFVEQLAASKQT